MTRYYPGIKEKLKTGEINFPEIQKKKKKAPTKTEQKLEMIRDAFISDLEDLTISPEKFAELPAPTGGGLISLSDVPGVRQQKKSWGEGTLGDFLIVDVRPYAGAIEYFEEDPKLFTAVVSELRDMYRKIKDAVHSEIGIPSSPGEGVVPMETGALRRSMWTSMNKNVCNVPDYAFSRTQETRLTIWLHANVPYAKNVSQYATNKVTCSGPDNPPKPAVRHPFNLPKCPQQDYSRKTGNKKRDKEARNDFFDRVLEIGRRTARREWNKRKSFLGAFFDIKIPDTSTGYGYKHLARNVSGSWSWQH